MQADNLRTDLKTQKQENKNLTSELQLTQATLQTKQKEAKTLGEGLKTVEEEKRNLTSELQSTQATLQTKQEEVTEYSHSGDQFQSRVFLYPDIQAVA